MPKLMDTTMEELTTSSNYTFSAVKIDELGSSKYTLVSIMTDASGSVNTYKNDIEELLKTILNSCQDCQEAENLLLRLGYFNNSGVGEIHGFKLLDSIDPDDYDGVLNCHGGTPLFDAAYTSIETTHDYAKILFDQDFDVNGIVFIITDGCDNMSTETAQSVKQIVERTIRSEHLDSMIVVLVGVGTGDSYIDDALDNFKQEAELTKYISMGNVTKNKLSKLAQFVSKSISSQSRSLDTGEEADVSEILVF